MDRWPPRTAPQMNTPCNVPAWESREWGTFAVFAAPVQGSVFWGTEKAGCYQVGATNTPVLMLQLPFAAPAESVTAKGCDVPLTPDAEFSTMQNVLLVVP